MPPASEESPFGTQRVVTVTVNGHRFTYRRPSRFELAEIRRRYVGKVTQWGRARETETNTLNNLDPDLEWDARFEIGLLPGEEDGKVIDRGETAPPHWFGKLPDGTACVSFVKVDPAEFVAVRDAVRAAVTELEKKASTTPRSTGPVHGTSSA